MGFEHKDRNDRFGRFNRDDRNDRYDRGDRNNRYDRNDRYERFDRNDRQERRFDQNNDRRFDSVFSNKLRAGKRRTYFFDVLKTRGNDYYLTITESTKRFDESYIRHKIFVYKEDFNRFLEVLTQTIDHVKTELLPDYDFDEFARRSEEREEEYLNSLENKGPREFHPDAHTEEEEKYHEDEFDDEEGFDEDDDEPAVNQNPSEEEEDDMKW